MKKFNLKKITSTLLAAAFTMAAFSSCQQAQPNPASNPDTSAVAAKPLAGKTIRLAINATFAPFESATVDTNGKTVFEGIDIDIANYLAETLGYTMEITDMTFDGLVGSLTSKRADIIISGISPTPTRLESVDFSTSYFFPNTAIVSRKDSPYPTPVDLKGKKVAVPFGTSYEAKAKTFEGVEVISINGSPSVIQELKNKRVDAAVLDGCQAAEFVKIHPELEFHLLPVEKLIEDSYAIAFQKDSEYKEIIDQALQDMMSNGELDKIIEKWLGKEYMETYKAGLE